MPQFILIFGLFHSPRFFFLLQHYFILAFVFSFRVLAFPTEKAFKLLNIWLTDNGFHTKSTAHEIYRLQMHIYLNHADNHNWQRKKSPTRKNNLSKYRKNEKNEMNTHKTPVFRPSSHIFLAMLFRLMALTCYIFQYFLLIIFKCDAM